MDRTYSAFDGAQELYISCGVVYRLNASIYEATSCLCAFWFTPCIQYDHAHSYLPTGNNVICTEIISLTLTWFIYGLFTLVQHARRLQSTPNEHLRSIFLELTLQNVPWWNHYPYLVAHIIASRKFLYRINAARWSFGSHDIEASLSPVTVITRPRLKKQVVSHDTV